MVGMVVVVVLVLVVVLLVEVVVVGGGLVTSAVPGRSCMEVITGATQTTLPNFAPRINASRLVKSVDCSVADRVGFSADIIASLLPIPAILILTASEGPCHGFN